MVKCKKDEKLYALKSLKKAKLFDIKALERTQSEVKILEVVDHPFIISLKYSFETFNKIYLITDYYSGGELFYHLRLMKRFNYELTKFYFAQITLAIEFLHNKKIIYRDLKPENIVLDSDLYIKLTDFGLAKENIEEGSSTTTFCGTNEYLAPEIIIGEKYGKSVDIWCMGIILFEMFFGIPPFYDSNKDRLYRKILFSEPDFNISNIIIPSDLKDLILKLLDKNPKNRIKIAGVKSHHFLDNFDFNLILGKKLTVPGNLASPTKISELMKNIKNVQ